jgi:hypothetical protein
MSSILKKKRKTKPTFEAVTRPSAPPKRERIGSLNAATSAELIAAVDGNLKARKTKGTLDQPALRTIGKNNMPVGRPLGITTGLPVFMAICFVLQENERRAIKRTDQQITEWLAKEFPGRNSNYFESAQMMRTNYNSGRYTREIVPSLQSHRYDSGGTMIDPTPGRGRKFRL